MKHIAIIGAGITGVTTCYALQRRGFQTTLIERHRYPAMQTSFANGGQLSASNAEVWNTPATLLKGLRWMLRKDAPLLLNPMPGWHKYTWMAEFAANIGKYKSHTIETVELAIAAREHLFAWAEQENISFDHKDRGILHFYNNEKGFRHAEKVNKLLSEGGLERHAVTPAEMSEIEPTLTGDFFGGFYTPSDSTGDIHLYTRGLADACKRGGTHCRFETQVLDVVADDNSVALELQDSDGVNRHHFDGLVVCAGVGSRRLAAEVGDRLNIYPVKGYSITVKLDDDASRDGAPQVSLLDDDAKVVTSRLGENRFRIAGTAEFNGANYDIRADRIEPLVSWCRSYFPDVATSRIVPWAGLRPMMPGMLPRVGQSKRCSRVFYNTGHGHLGWTLSAATAEIVAANVVAAKLSGKVSQGQTGGSGAGVNANASGQAATTADSEPSSTIAATGRMARSNEAVESPARPAAADDNNPGNDTPDNDYRRAG